MFKILGKITKVKAKVAAIAAASTIVVAAIAGTSSSASAFEIPSFISNLLPPEITNLYTSIQSTYNNIASLATAIAADPSMIGQMGNIDFQKLHQSEVADANKPGGDILSPTRTTGQAAVATGTAMLTTKGQEATAQQVKAQAQYAQSADNAAQKAVSASSSLIAIGENTKALAVVSNQIKIQHAATIQGNQIAASGVQAQAVTNAELEKAANDRDRAKAETGQLVNNQFNQPLMVSHEPIEPGK
jgi:hypothetical protein